MSATAINASSVGSDELFISIPLTGVQLLDSKQINFYRLRERGARPLLLNDATWNLDEEQLVEMKICGEDFVHIRKQDFSAVSQTLNESLDSILVDTSITLEERFALLQLTYAAEIERCFRKTHLRKYVELAAQIGDQLATLAGQGDLSLKRLHHHLHHNAQHYTHLTNVASYAMVLVQGMESCSSQILKHIAVGCLLHEVGKLFLPANLLSKHGRLSSRDTQELERVPQLAYEALLEFEGLEFGQRMMAYQQHERVDGTGYPVRTLCEDIHPWAKLLAVVDEFDAITCQRPYRAAVGLQDGLLHLSSLANSKLDSNMVRCLITNSKSQ